MQMRRLGKRGPEVGVIGFGAWAIGGMNWGPTDDAVSMRALHEALDQGVTFIDTADVYGFGHSEELIARLIRERGRKDFFIATKAGNDFYYASEEDDAGYGPIRQNYSRDYLIEAAEKSLKRLGVEALDLLQLHSPDLEKLEQDEAWEALEILKRDGKILHAGLSIQSFRETEQAHLLDRHQGILDAIQVRYNLLEREAEEVLFPKALEHGIGVIVRIPILFGFLSGKFDENSSFSPEDHRSMNLSREKILAYQKGLMAVRHIFDENPDDTMVQTALKFCINHPAVSTVIPGAKTPEQVRENCAAGR